MCVAVAVVMPSSRSRSASRRSVGHSHPVGIVETTHHEDTRIRPWRDARWSPTPGRSSWAADGADLAQAPAAVHVRRDAGWITPSPMSRAGRGHQTDPFTAAGALSNVSYVDRRPAGSGDARRPRAARAARLLTATVLSASLTINDSPYRVMVLFRADR